jgi:AraC family transcriptional regulator, arabinose operon regulatory protein
MNRLEKTEGFPGQRIVVLPSTVVERAQCHPLLTNLLPTDIGYFPRARGHLMERPNGVAQAICIYCTKGAGWCEINGRRHSVHAEELLVVPPNTPHVYGADEKRPWSIDWFHVQGNLVRAFLDELGITLDHPTLSIGISAQLLSLFNEVLEVLEHGYAPLQLIYSAQTLAHLLAAMVFHHREGWNEQSGTNQKVAQTINYMKEHLHQSLQLDALAAVANLARSQYSTLFKKQTSYTPIDYFIRLKMHRACQFLDTTQSSVKVIAASLGYEDPLYFSRVFRLVNKVSPQAYRQMRKG